MRIAIAPTVGFLVQVVKGTALASVIGFVELTKAGSMITNATFKPFVVYSCVALLYFVLCFPDQPVRQDPRKETPCRPSLNPPPPPPPRPRRGAPIVQITALRKSYGTQRGAEGHRPRRASAAR